VADALALHGGGRFRNASRLGVDLDGVPLHRLCEGEEGARTLRWLRRRGAARFAAWFGLLVLPALLAVRWLAAVNDALGAIALLAASVAIWVVGFRLFDAQNTCRSLVEHVARVRGTALVTGLDDAEKVDDLRAGRAGTLPAGSVRLGRGTCLVIWHGRRAVPRLLLSDPRTGLPRAREDLSALADTLAGSPHPRDQDASRVVAELATSAPTAGRASMRRPRDEQVPVGEALRGVGRALRWALVGVAYGVATSVAWPAELRLTGGVTGGLLAVMTTVLLGTWGVYLGYHGLQLLRAAGRAVTAASARRL
jgi:hypothetical protein